MNALNIHDFYSCKIVGEVVEEDTGWNFTCSQHDLITATKISILKVCNMNTDLITPLKDIIIPTITKAFENMIDIEPVSGNLILSEVCLQPISGTKRTRRSFLRHIGAGQTAGQTPLCRKLYLQQGYVLILSIYISRFQTQITTWSGWCDRWARPRLSPTPTHVITTYFPKGSCPGLLLVPSISIQVTSLLCG